MVKGSLVQLISAALFCRQTLELTDCAPDEFLKEGCWKTHARASDGAELLVTMLSKIPINFDGQQPMLLIA